jgi:phosphatidylglycerophosphate synthase
VDRRQIPITLTRSRLILGPLVLAETIIRASWWIVAATLIAALLSDIFDGVLARRWKIVTPELRIADSRADGVYTFCLIVAISIRCSQQVAALWPGLVLLGCMELASTVIDFWRYGKPSSHHAYTAKAWALSFCILAIASLCFGKVEPYLVVCVALGFVNNLEGYVIRALLPEWAHDISGIPAALRLRKMQISKIAGTSAFTNEVI